MKRIIGVFVLLSSFFIYSCDEVTDSNSANVSGDWIIPKEKVFDGGPGKDGIPALNLPSVTEVSSATYLSPGQLVVGVVVDGVARAYPHAILDWHEIINDNVNGDGVTVTYCPLTGSAIGYNRMVDGTLTTFGVSGLLYNSNLIPYDRLTDSNWSQMLMKSVSGKKKGSDVKIYQVVETSWGTWTELYPDTKVLSNNTGYDRDYSRYPYGTYRDNHDYLIFPVDNDDSRLPRKERVLGVTIGEEAKAYRFASFASGTRVINDNIAGSRLVVVGNENKNFIIAFTPEGPFSDYEFQPIENEAPAIFKDAVGNKYDILGNVLEGPQKGDRLKSPKSFIAFWFAWGAFYPGTLIHEF